MGELLVARRWSFAGQEFSITAADPTAKNDYYSFAPDKAMAR
jgi:hypothetical protein